MIHWDFLWLDVFGLISLHSTFQDSNEAEFELLTDTFEIDHSIEEMQKIKSKNIGVDYKYMNLKWITGLIFTT